MKRSILIALFITLLFASGAWGEAACFSSGEQAADAAVITGNVKLCGVEVYTDGTNAATATLYDNTSAAGTKLVYIKVTGASHFGGATWEHTIQCSKGIYLDIEGTNAKVIVYYK